MLCEYREMDSLRIFSCSRPMRRVCVSSYVCGVVVVVNIKNIVVIIVLIIVI